MDWIETLLKIVQPLSVVIASGTAIWGICKWRREFVGKRRIELAEETLTLFYEARDAIGAIRNIGGYVGEGSSRPPEENESQIEAEIKNEGYVWQERFEKREKVFHKLLATRYRFMALFGVEQEKPFENLRGLVIKILSRATIRTVYKLQLLRLHDSERIESVGQKIQELEAFLWAGADPDPITPELDQIVKEIEQSCRSIIDGALTSRFSRRKKSKTE